MMLLLCRAFATKRHTPSVHKQFFKEMRACNTAADLELLVASAPKTKFNDVNIATALTRLSELGTGNAQAVRDVLERANEYKFKPGELMDICVGISQLDSKLNESKIPEFISKQIVENTAIPYFKPRFFSFILFSYFQLGQNDLAVCEALAMGMVEKQELDKFGVDDFAIILDSLAGMGYLKMNAVCERVATELLLDTRTFTDVDTTDLALILASLAPNLPSARFKHVIAKLRPEIETKLVEFDTKELELIHDCCHDDPELQYLVDDELASRMLDHE